MIQFFIKEKNTKSFIFSIPWGCSQSAGCMILSSCAVKHLFILPGMKWPAPQAAYNYSFDCDSSCINSLMVSNLLKSGFVRVSPQLHLCSVARCLMLLLSWRSACVGVYGPLCRCVYTCFFLLFLSGFIDIYLQWIFNVITSTESARHTSSKNVYCICPWYFHPALLWAVRKSAVFHLQNELVDWWFESSAFQG